MSADAGDTEGRGVASLDDALDHAVARGLERRDPLNAVAVAMVATVLGRRANAAGVVYFAFVAAFLWLPWLSHGWARIGGPRRRVRPRWGRGGMRTLPGRRKPWNVSRSSVGTVMGPRQT